MKCHSCRQANAGRWITSVGGKRVLYCCGPSDEADRLTETQRHPDVRQWLRTRHVKVSWLIRAPRTVR